MRVPRPSQAPPSKKKKIESGLVADLDALPGIWDDEDGDDDN